MTSKDETTDVQLDISKYDGHTEGPWGLHHFRKDGQDLWELDAEGVHALYIRPEADAKLIADAPLLLEEVKRLRAELDHERNAGPGSVSNERIWEQIDRDNLLAAQRVRERLDIEVKETEGEGGYVKYPDPGCGLDSETGRFNMENHEWVNATERLWLDAVQSHVKQLREKNRSLFLRLSEAQEQLNALHRGEE